MNLFVMEIISNVESIVTKKRVTSNKKPTPIHSNAQTNTEQQHYHHPTELEKVKKINYPRTTPDSH